MIATSLRHESELDLRLPEASGSPLPSHVATLEVDIDAQGRYAVKGQSLESADASALKTALQAAAQGRDLPLILRVDGRTAHQAVVTVLEAAGQLGLKQLAIATVNPPAAPSSTVAPPAPDP